MAQNSQQPAAESQGVGQLIERLRSQGVAAGAAEAEALLAKARQQADDIVARARDEAEQLKREAQQQTEKDKAAAEAALQLAVRDAVLSVQERLANQFSRQFERRLREAFDSQEFLQRLIAAVARQSIPAEEHALQVELPPELVSDGELQQSPEQLREGSLAQFVRSLTAKELREGITFVAADQHISGIRVQLTDSDLEVDLSERAVGELLLRHLLPRFREMLTASVNELSNQPHDPRSE